MEETFATSSLLCTTTTTEHERVKLSHSEPLYYYLEYYTLVKNLKVNYQNLKVFFQILNYAFFLKIFFQISESNLKSDLKVTKPMRASDTSMTQ
jgi:hypothetical protein